MSPSDVTAIVDYGVGNLHSVRHALATVGANAVITKDPAELRRAARIVLPGVGAFGACMENLVASGLLKTLEEEILVEQKPLLGICVGMQILATEGEEDGRHAGLGWIPGRVRLLVPDEAHADLPVPHMGWNDLRVVREHSVLSRLSRLSESAREPTFYFVHSYVFVPDAPAHVAATCDYGGEFACVIAKDNIIATQFHPEKSQEAGYALLEGFLQWTPEPAVTARAS